MPLPSVFQGGSRLPFARPQTLQTPPQAFKATTLTATCLCHLFFKGYMPLLSVFPGVQDCRLPAPQTLQTLPQASKATTFTATCLCHLFFRGFKTAVCPPSNAPNPSAGLQGNNSSSYMPLPSVFQGVQDCRLPGFKRSKPVRRPPRQQLLQLHAPAICFSGGSRLPFARPQTLQTPPQASKATTLTATCPCHLLFRGSRLPFARLQTLQTPPQASKATTLTATCPCHLFLRGFKTAVCPASNAPNPSAGLQGNNSYSYVPLPSVFHGVQQTPPQASKATTLTATCPCHLFFRGFKTAVCPASNAPNPSAAFQGNNSYPLPSVFHGVQDCRLPGLKRSKPLRRPPRQQLLQLHAPAICFSRATCPCHLFFRGSRLPFARPQTLQTLPQASKATTLIQLHTPAICFSGGSRLPFARPQTLQTPPQASKATTLTATCPCHLFFKGFKTAVCPASKAPNLSAGLQGNNSYSYMPLPSVFRGVQDCRLLALKRSKPLRRPPRQQLLQLHAPAICFSRGSRLPFARPQTLQTPPQASKATTLTATCPCHLFFRGFKTAVCPASNAPNPSAGLQGNNSYSYMPLPSIFQVPFARPQTLQTPPQPSKATTLTATCPCHLFFRGFKTAVCPPSNAPNPSAGLQGNNSYTATCPCHLFFRRFKTAVCPPSNAPNPSAGLQGNNSYSYMPLPSVFKGLHAPAICFSGVQDCRLPGIKRSKPFRRPPRQQFLYSYMPLPSVFQGVGDCRLPALKRSKPLRRPPRQQLLYSYMPLPFFFQGVQDCRLPSFKGSKPLRRPPRQQLLQLHAPAICFPGGSRLPFARLQTLQTPPQASKATTLAATCPCHLFFRGFKTAVCPASNAPNPSASLQGNNSYSYMPLPSVFQGVQNYRPPSNAPNPSAGLQGNNSCSYMPLPSVFQGVQDCCLPALKRSKPLRRPPRQQLLQLHAPAICFSRGSRLPFARPQTLQTLLQASKATTLILYSFFRGFKTAVCPPSNAPNPSAGLQGNNSYSYMPLPSVFQGVQDCRLPALKRSKPFRRPPRQQLLQLHASAICFSGGSRLPFARPQTLQTPPQASKATTLPATCPCHLFFKGFKIAVCPPSNAPNPSAGLQGNNSYTATCPCHLFFRGFKTAVCPPSNAPNPSAGLQGNNSYSYMPLPSVFQGVQDCRLPGFKGSKPLCKPPRQQLLQLHAPAICFSGGSRLPFARPHTLQTPPQASKATTLTATCPCHLFFRGFKTAVCPASNAPNPSASLQGNNSYSYMPLPSVFQGVQDCRSRPQRLQTCFSGGSRLPFARPQTLQTPPQASKATTLTATCPCHLFFKGYMPLPSVFPGVQDCRLPGF